MKNIYMLFGVLYLTALTACDPNNYLSELYIQPSASFEIEKDTYDVFESVLFTNKGKAQYYVVFPGDEKHIYGKEGDIGFPTTENGTFSYSYREPGTYNAVWVASSINEKGEKEFVTDSVKIKVVARDGGLDNLSIYNIYKLDEYSTGGLNVFFTSYGSFVSADTLLCPILFPSWRDATVNSIKAKQLVNFELSSSIAKMYWINQGAETEIISMSTGSRIVMFVEDGKLKTQNFRVKTASGTVSNYYVAPVMIPQFTKFSINGVAGTIIRSISAYEVYDVEVDLPNGTDLTQLKPEFEVMKNNPNLLDGSNCKITLNGTTQISGVTPVNLSSGTVEYRIDYRLMGSSNPKLTQTGIMRVKIK